MSTINKAYNPLAGKAQRVLDLSRFACGVFNDGHNPRPDHFMRAISQANHLLRPDALLLDFPYVARLALGRDQLEPGGLASLREWLAQGQGLIEQYLVATTSALHPPIDQVLDLGSIVDWIAFSNIEIDDEIDDMDAEDILVYLVNALQRIDLAQFAAISVDATTSVAGNTAEITQSVANFCLHQGKMLLATEGVDTAPSDPGKIAKHRLRAIDSHRPWACTAYRLAATTTAEQAADLILKHEKN